MVEKKYRVTKEKDFTAIRMSGRASYGPYFLVKYLRNQFPYSRFGLIVSNKVSKKASQRNLIKRRLREILRLHYGQLAKGYDLVLIVSPKIISANKVLKYQLLEASLLKCLKKAGLL